jgi:hypothetical protein
MWPGGQEIVDILDLVTVDFMRRGYRQRASEELGSLYAIRERRKGEVVVGIYP